MTSPDQVRDLALGLARFMADQAPPGEIVARKLLAKSKF